jgi:hypothetical protein
MSTDLPYSTQPLQPGPPPRTSGTAIAALIVAIGSYFVCPLIGAIIALVLAASATRELDQYPGQLTGHGLVTAARWLAAIHFAIVGLFIGVVLILVAGFGVSLFGLGLHQPSSVPAPVQSPPNATNLGTSPSQTTSPPETTGPAPPDQVVENFYDAINAHDYQTAWALLAGNKLGQTYQQFVAGFARTADDALTVTGVNGNTVAVELVATQDDGSVRTYRGTYTVQVGRIIEASIRRIS